MVQSCWQHTLPNGTAPLRKTYKRSTTTNLRRPTPNQVVSYRIETLFVVEPLDTQGLPITPLKKCKKYLQLGKIFTYGVIIFPMGGFYTIFEIILSIGDILPYWRFFFYFSIFQCLILHFGLIYLFEITLNLKYFDKI